MLPGARDENFHTQKEEATESPMGQGAFRRFYIRCRLDAGIMTAVFQQAYDKKDTLGRLKKNGWHGNPEIDYVPLSRLVRIQGVASKPELNGKLGFILNYYEETARCEPTCY